MLKAIRDFVEKQIMTPEETGDRNASEHALRLATAALLVEMSRQDETVHDKEREAVATALRERFELQPEEVDELYALAEAEVKEAIDYYQFTSLIKDHFSPEQKERIVELLWQVAAADGHIDSFEEHMVRRIADLLYLPHSAFIRAKHRALGQ
ncbi:MAG: TerB family tellurite resistance protein [Pseudomonadota bacterium]